MKIKQVAVLGANGIMGSRIATMIAKEESITVYMIARNHNKINHNKKSELNSTERLVYADYSQAAQILSHSDWIIEAVAEDLTIKKKINKIIAKHAKKDCIISTTTSSLSVQELSKSFDSQARKYYFGAHFFNPPQIVRLCELILTSYSNTQTASKLKSFLQNVLERKVIVARDTPGFIANRIGFQLINEAAQAAQKYANLGGVAYVDLLLGACTGRAMAPLATLDYIGLDTHQAICENIYKYTCDDARNTFIVPDYLKRLISQNKLGRKTNGGLYKIKQLPNGTKQKLTYDIETQTYRQFPKKTNSLTAQMELLMREEKYIEAFEVVKKTKEEGSIIKHFLARYISYSFSMIGNVVDDIDSVDQAMINGFFWAPPTMHVQLLGGVKETIKLLQKENVTVPNSLQTWQQKASNKQNYSDYFRV